MIKAFTIGAICAALMACAATGVKVTDEQLAGFRPGQTTIEQVLSALGPPTTRMRLADGTTMLQYVYAEAKVRAASLVPIVGVFAGGTDVRSNVATLRFDASGKLIDVSSAESQYGTGVGTSAGTITPAPVPQPRQ